ncbi:MAG: TFIIB-type zinc ribbon-containing protein [Planctomycetota bacterium]
MIEFKCSHCGRSIRVRDDYAGKRGKCPSCGQVIQIPGAPIAGSQKQTAKIRFSCENCGQGFKVSSKHAGKQVKCSQCGQGIVVPNVRQEPQPKAVTPAAAVPAGQGDDALRLAPLESKDAGLSDLSGVGGESEIAYFKHSGKFTPAGILLMALFGLGTAVVGGIVYAYATFYIPFVYLNVIMTLLLGAGVGSCVGIAAKLGKVRNLALVALSGLFAGLVAEYIAWVFWILAASGHEALVLSPIGILQAWGMLAKDGVWEIFGSTPRGGILYLLWIIEFVIIVGGAALIPLGKIATLPFCERCDSWVQNKEKYAPFEPVSDVDGLKAQLEEGDFRPLGMLKRIESESELFTSIDLISCPDCGDMHLLTINSVKVEIKKDGKRSEDETGVVENLVVTSEILNKLRNVFQSS